LNPPKLTEGQRAQLVESTAREVHEQSMSSDAIDNSSLDLQGIEQDQLTFIISQDSWIEVIDAADRRLIYQLARAGEVSTVSGVAPFNIHLGYLPGVDILLNGEPYSLSRFGNRRSVRFDLNVKNRRPNNG
jgi:cytoskeleton protein RodZ